MSKYLELSGGYKTLVDDSYYNELLEHSWQSLKIKDKVYAARTTKEGSTEYLHRRLTKVKAGLEVDHIDGDGLNNQLNNLRVVTQSQNQRNAKRSSANTSGFKGVSFNSVRKLWEGYLYLDREKISFGFFSSPEEASEVVEKNRPTVHGEFGRSTS